VPPAPEILQAFCEIRLAEVDHEVETKKLRTAASNTAVAAKVAVNLPSERICSEQHGHRVGPTEIARIDGIAMRRSCHDDHFSEKPSRIRIKPSKALEGSHERGFCTAEGDAMAVGSVLQSDEGKG